MPKLAQQKTKEELLAEAAEADPRLAGPHEADPAAVEAAYRRAGIVGARGRPRPEGRGPAALAAEVGAAREPGKGRPRRGARPKERLANSDPIVQ